MKKDKAWAKEQLEYYIKAVGDPFNNHTRAMINAYKNVEHIINQLDEPEKPVVPQFVADYIEQSKKDNDSINQVFAFIDDKEDKDLWHWLFPSVYEEKRANQEVFMRAWLDGYEVEKEKLYRIKFSDNQYASRFNDRKINSVLTDEELAAQYTEAEIKAIDERYWAFAEEVTE